MNLNIDSLDARPVDRLAVEVVEHKGLGHPDSICDGLAEALSLSLSRFYRDRFGLILHHNLDKVLLVGGEASPAFGGGQVIRPIEVLFAGRATTSYDGVDVPITELASEVTLEWLGAHFHALDPRRHVRVQVLIRPGSQDLVELYRRQHRTGVRLANDSSCGVGYAPLSTLETVTYQIGRRLSSDLAGRSLPALGQDVKVMGIRQGSALSITVAAALVGRFLENAEAYMETKATLAGLVRKIVESHCHMPVAVEVNAADDPNEGSLYLTVTGTSAEAGDDGEAGRGNRANGLITPYRPMTMESVAGKNPVTHVGKLYNLSAGLMAAALVENIPAVASATCVLVSQIGRPIDDPQIVDLRLRTVDGSPVEDLTAQVEEIVRAELDGVGRLADALLDGTVAPDRWPLRSLSTRQPAS
jgi:S-adenosylmethionine synthetase